MEPNEQKLQELHDDFKQYIEKAKAEEAQRGVVLTETKTALESIKTQMDAVQKQTDAIDLKIVERGVSNPEEGKSLGDMFVESESFMHAKEASFMPFRTKDGRIRAAVKTFPDQRKSLISTTGMTSQTTGVQPLTRLPGIVTLPMQELRIRDIMGTPQKMTQGNAFDYLRQQTRQSSPSPQVEGQPKAESTYTWEAKTGTIKTIAHWTNITRQAVDDIPWLRSAIDTELMYGLLLKEEAELLAGDGTGQHLLGLITTATAYNTALNVAADTQLDKLRHAKLQCRLAGLATFAPDGLVLNPTDMAKIELIKTEEGGANKGVYIIGNPTQGTPVKYVWGLPVVESDSIAAGTFLMGAFSTAARIIDRMDAMVEISYENGTNFVNNVVTLLCEERLGLAVMRPEAFVTGSI